MVPGIEIVVFTERPKNRNHGHSQKSGGAYNLPRQPERDRTIDDES
jgi:hypothetical protein